MGIGAVAFKLSRNVKALGWVSFFSDVQSETILPLLPLFITQVLGLNRSFLGLIEGIADSSSSLLKVASGYYSDKVKHRKRPTAVGYILSTLAKPLLAFSTAGPHVLGIRLTDRVGKGIRTAPRDALIAESASADTFGRAFGFHRMMDTLGAVVGTMIAYAALKFLGGSEEHRMRSAFLFSAIFGAAAVAILLFFVREVAPSQHDKREETPEPSRGSRGRLIAFIGITVIFHLGMFSYAFFLLRAQSLGLAAVNLPLIYLVYNVIYALTAFQMGKLADHVGAKPVILLAYTSYAVLCLGFVFASAAWHAWMLFGLYGIHSAAMNPTSRALVSSLSETHSRGTALGAYHTSAGIAALPASLIAGILWDTYGASMPFIFGGALAFIASLAMLALPLGIKEDHSENRS